MTTSKDDEDALIHPGSPPPIAPGIQAEAMQLKWIGQLIEFYLGRIANAVEEIEIQVTGGRHGL